MNNSLLMPIIDTDIIMVEVQFLQSDIYHDTRDNRSKKTHRNTSDPNAWSMNYTYKAHKSLRLELGSTVMVQARNWYQIAKVVAVDVAIPMDDSSTTYRWVVCNVAPAIAQLNETIKHERDVGHALDRKRAEAAREQALEALGLTQADIMVLTQK